MVRALLRGLVIVLLAACARCEESAGLEEQSAPEAEVEAGDNTTGIAAASGGIGVLFLLLVGICVVRVFGSRNNVAMREAEVRLASASNSGGNPPPRDSTDMSGELQDTPPMVPFPPAPPPAHDSPVLRTNGKRVMLDMRTHPLPRRARIAPLPNRGCSLAPLLAQRHDAPPPCVEPAPPPTLQPTLHHTPS